MKEETIDKVEENFEEMMDKFNLECNLVDSKELRIKGSFMDIFSFMDEASAKGLLSVEERDFFDR